MAAGACAYSHIIPVEIGDVIKPALRCNQVATGMPWLAYTTAPTTWTIDLSDSTYWHYASFNARLKALTLSGLMHWLFYEVAARIPPRAAARMTLMGGYHWLRCPRPAARALVGSLHALLTQVVARCE